MQLPKINYPTFTIQLPNKELTFRVLTVVEEKLLLMASESNSGKEILDAVKQVIRNCLIEPSALNVNKLASFEIELIYLNLFARSKNDYVEVTIRGIEDSPCKTCQENKEFKIKIEDIKLQSSSEVSNIVELTDTFKVKMKYPSADSTMYLLEYRNNFNLLNLIKVIPDCIEILYDNETQYEIDSRKDLEEWINQLPAKSILKCQDFIDNIPILRYVIEYKCPECGHESKIVLEGLESFLL